MKKALKVLSVFLAACFTGEAVAQDNVQTHGFFVGLEAGIVQHTVDVSGVGTNYEEESGNSFSPDLSFGYNFNSNWSIVAQYTNYGEADLFDADVELEVEDATIPINLAFSTKTTGFSLVGQYMTERSVGHWSVGAKLGLIKWKTDFNTHTTSGSYSDTQTDSDSGIAAYGGLNCAYAMTQALDLTMGVDWFVNDLDVEIINNAKTDMQYSRLGVGLKYNW